MGEVAMHIIVLLAFIVSMALLAGQ